MEFEARYLPCPCITPSLTDDFAFDHSEVLINPVKISSIREQTISWVNEKNKPVYENCCVIVVDGHIHYIVGTKQELMIAVNTFLSLP